MMFFQFVFGEAKFKLLFPPLFSFFSHPLTTSWISYSIWLLWE